MQNKQPIKLWGRVGITIELDEGKMRKALEEGGVYGNAFDGYILEAIRNAVENGKVSGESYFIVGEDAPEGEESAERFKSLLSEFGKACTSMETMDFMF